VKKQGKRSWNMQPWRRKSTSENWKIWLGYLHERYDDSDEVWKRKRPLTVYIFWRCVNVYVGRWCELEDVMMKDHHKGNFDLMSIPYFWMISGWAYAGLPREELWISSTTDVHVVVFRYRESKGLIWPPPFWHNSVQVQGVQRSNPISTLLA